MNNIEFKNTELLDSYIKNNYIELLGSGREGNSFLLPNDIVLKKLYKKRNINYLNRFDGIKIDGVVFARGGIIIDKSVYGLLLKYVEGKSFNKIDYCELDLNELAISLNNLLKIIKELSNKGICISDFYIGNIIYDGNDFTLIDTQDYYYKDIKDLYIENVNIVMKNLYRCLFYNNYMIHSFLLNSNLKDYYYDYYLLSNPIVMINELIVRFQIKYEIKVSNISEMKRVLSK